MDRPAVMSSRVSFSTELRATAALAVPIVVGQVGQHLMGITDSVMIGQVGKVPLAASAFALGVCNLALIVGVGLLLPVAVLTARAHGARQPRECAEYLRHGIALAAVISVAMLVVLAIVGSQLHRFGQPAEVLAEVGPYFVLLALSMVPAFFFQVLKQYSEALGHPWAPMGILLGCVGLNGLLNWIFIWGHWGAPAWGLAGAGFATLLARVAALVLLLAWLRRKPDVRAEWPTAWRAPLSRARFAEMLHIGVPAAGQWLFEAGAFSAAAFMMGWIGTVPLAAHQIALSCAGFTFMFALGISSAVSVRIAKARGEGRTDALRPIGFGAFVAAFVVMGVFGIVFALGGTWIARGFTPEVDVVTVAAQLLAVAALFQLSDGAQVVGAGALRGLSDVKVPTAITFVAYWIFALPGGYLLAFHTPLGSTGVWVGLAAGLSVAAGLLAWRFHQRTRAGVGTG
jgi:MATE family multidrug resistance protein